MKSLNQFCNVMIVYYSGTGGTEKVADIFRENLINRDKQVEIEKISSNNMFYMFNGNNINNYDCLILFFSFPFSCM
jgi:flavodoxin